MKSSEGFEPVSLPVPAPVKTFQAKSLFVNEKLKILNLNFEFQNVVLDF